MSIAVPNPAAYELFYKMALEYYVAGRAALLCGSSLITGNLLHHAVEMLLKGQLSKTISLKDLAHRDKFHHKLPKLWTAFKGLFPAENLTEFDAMIDELDKFEKIRYPNDILAQGAVIGLGFGRGKSITTMTPGRTEPAYQVGIGDIDAFCARLFPLCRLNPGYFCLSQQSRQILTEANEESNYWLP